LACDPCAMAPRHLALNVIAAAAFLDAALAQPTVPCRWSPPDYPGLSYDLSSMYSSTLDYNWRDPYDFETTQSNYTFNVCANVNNPPVACAGMKAPAFQVTGSGGGPVCYRLGIDLTSVGYPNKVSWGLIDPVDPSAGVTLTYLAATISPNCPPGVYRTFTLEMGCSAGPVPQPGPPQTDGIDETNVCNYRAHAWSLAGCPQREWLPPSPAVRPFLTAPLCPRWLCRVPCGRRQAVRRQWRLPNGLRYQHRECLIFCFGWSYHWRLHV
jgi:hypothetical protein